MKTSPSRKNPDFSGTAFAQPSGSMMRQTIGSLRAEILLKFPSSRERTSEPMAISSWLTKKTTIPLSGGKQFRNRLGWWNFLSPDGKRNSTRQTDSSRLTEGSYCNLPGGATSPNKAKAIGHDGESG